MLQIFSLKEAHDWHKLLSDFNPSTDTWVVADLKSKLEIQQRLFARYRVLPEESILRASELWKLLFKQQGSNLQVVSTSFAKVFISEQLENEEEHWLKVPGAHKTIMDYIRQLFPLLIDPQSQEILGPWWNENSGSLMRWGRWFFVAQNYVQRFLDKNWLLPQWIPYLLLNKFSSQLCWRRKMYIDLGSQMTQCEAQLFNKMSEEAETYLLCPQRIFQSEYATLQRTYSRFFDIKNKFSTEESLLPNNMELKRFSTALAEVKDVSAQMRHWIQQGYSPDQLAVLAPDIEYYWPVLSSYLEKEGLPVQKKTVVRAQSFLPIMSWLSRLKLELGKVSSEDLELDVFSSENMGNSYSYYDFKKVYALILEDQQLHRLQEISQRYQQKINPQQLLYRDEFLIWAINHFNEEFESSHLEPILRNTLKDSLNNVKLKAATWLVLLENLAAQTEITIKDESPQGVHVENFLSARHLDVKCIYVMGLSESQLRTKNSMGLKPGEVFCIEKDLGYVLDWPDSQGLEFEAENLLNSTYKHKVASCAETNFAGDPQAASLLWLKLARELNKNHHKVDTPQLSKWDLEQQQISESQQNLPLRSQFIDRDLGNFQFPNSVTQIQSLSVSRLQKYRRCPFVFLAEAMFKLKDPQLLDLDVDVMSYGQFLHKILQDVVGDPFRDQWSEVELQTLIEKHRKSFDFHIYDERSWYRMKILVLKTISRFLVFEREWRKTFPDTKTIGKEVAIKAYWQQDIADFVKEAEKGILFKGSIDRVDVDNEGHAVVLDYKSSSSQVFNYKTWLEKDHFQLSVYSYLLEKGFSEQIGRAHV